VLVCNESSLDSDVEGSYITTCKQVSAISLVAYLRPILLLVTGLGELIDIP